MTAIALVVAASVAPAQPDTLWTRVYGSDSLADIAESVRQTADGGYIVVGTTYSYGSGSLVWAVRLDRDGDTVWTRTYGGPGLDGANDVRQMEDGGYIIGGALQCSTDYDVYLVRTDSLGDTAWTRTYGGSSYDAAFSVCAAQDGGCIVGGVTRSRGAGGADMWLLRVDSLGDTTWTRTYGGAADDYGRSAIPAPGGGYVFVGETQSFGSGQSDVYVVRTRVHGDTAWTQAYGTGAAEGAYEAAVPSDSEYVVAGYACDGVAGDPDFWLLKLDAGGDTAWTRTYGGEMNDWCRSVVPAEDGGYMMAGATSSFGSGLADLWTVKADADGQMLWWRTVGGDNDDEGMHAAPTSDGGYVACGHTRSFGGSSFNFYVVRLASDLGVDGERPTARCRPAAANLCRSVVLLHDKQGAWLVDVSGRRVEHLQPGENDIGHVAPGVYFVREEGEPSDGTCEDAEPRGQGSHVSSVQKVVLAR